MEIHLVLYRRLHALFGEPGKRGDVYQWHVPCAPNLDIHINLDMLTAPNLVTVWVFDPCRRGADATRCYRVEGLNDVERVITEITEWVRPSSRQ